LVEIKRGTVPLPQLATGNKLPGRLSKKLGRIFRKNTTNNAPIPWCFLTKKGEGHHKVPFSSEKGT
jgi:hypothetical protein